MLKRRGDTIIEVVVASVILGMAAVAVASLLVSTFAAPKRESVQYEIAFAAKKLREQLKGYVTADPAVTLNAPGSPAWHLPGDTNPGWAFAAGSHNVTSMLSEELRTRYNATMIYGVTWENFKGRSVPKVRITVDWGMP